MKRAVRAADGKQLRELQLPQQFEEPVRADLIRRAVHALRRNRQHPYGSSPEAGMRHSSWVSKRRRDYRTSYGKGISRVARKILSRRGTQFNWVGAFSPQTVGGRRAHPPKAETQRIQKLNIKERRKAIRSALAATQLREIAISRGHLLPAEYPFVLDAALEQKTRSSELRQALEALGFTEELVRAAVKKVRAGKGKLRGRKYKKRKSILLVAGDACPLQKAARNLPGVDIVPVSALNAELLAPGGQPGRCTLFTEKALKVMEEKKLFL